MSDCRRVLLVGHCWPDAQMLRNAVQRAVPGAPVALANEMHVLEDCLGPDCVLLINREMDGDFPLRFGIDLIKELSHRQPRPEMMLISNYADAQEHAMAAGARRGFGKSSVHSEATTNLIRDAIRPNGSLNGDHHCH